jgi:PAS domain S-box-containing protein
LRDSNTPQASESDASSVGVVAPTFKTQLGHSEERFRLLVESVKDYAIFMLDTDGVIATWNPGAERLKGYKPEEAIGKHFSIFYTQEDLDDGKPARELKIAIAEGKYEEEGWRLRKDGSRFWALVVITAMWDEQGILRGFAKVTRDMSDRRLLVESEERLRLLLASVKDYAIFMLDPKGLIASWNPGAEQIYGYSTAEVVGKHFSKFYLPEDRPAEKTAEELEIALAEDRFEEEGWRIRQDGKRFWADVIITPVREADGRVRGFAKVTRDVTDRMRMENDLRDLNRQLESFAYSVSHDLRAPLRSVAFTSRVLLDDLREKLDGEHVEMLEEQVTSATKLAAVIDALLTLSRISRKDLQRKTLDITAMAKDIVDEVSEKTQANVTVQVEEGLTARGDQSLVRTILLNLIENACKFSPAGGTVQVGLQRNPRAFFVRDEGVGFEMEYAHKIFLPFERLVTDKEFEGTGIGLANVQQAVLRHGGKVWAESEPGKGSTFYFTID